MKKFARHPQTHTVHTLVKAALFTSCLSIVNVALAEGNTESASVPYTPGFTVMGLTGDFTTGYADVMIPLFGQPTSFFYLDPQGLIQNENYTASLGAGFRHLSESVGILGAYVFGDYNQSSNGNGFWFVSPGIERLGKTVDFGANLYIPTSTQRKDVSSTTGLEMGTYDYITFQEHSEFDGLFTTFESVGMGADAEIGVRIPMTNNPKLYVGGYYFNPEDANDNITGVTARLEVPLTDQLTFLVSDGYDNVENNTFKLGLSYNFGGRKNSKSFKGDLTERMVDPIHRNLIAVSGGSKTGEPIVQTVDQSKVLIRDDIAFFNVAESVNGDGTYENPFNEMTQPNVDTALGGGNNNFYVNSGTYEVGDNTITLTNTNLYGRQSYNGNPFVLSAVGDNRPLFDFDLGINQPGFLLTGTQNLFDSVRLQGGDGVNGHGRAIYLNNTNNTALTINNSEVNYFQWGVYIQNTGNVDLDIMNSSFEHNTTDALFFWNMADNATGNINIVNSSFTNNSVGMDVENNGNLNLTTTDSTFDHNVYGVVINSLASTSEVNFQAINSSFNENDIDGLTLINYGHMVFEAIASSFDGNANTGVRFQNFGDADFSATDSNFNHNLTGLVFINDGNALLEMTNSNINNNTGGLSLFNSTNAEIFEVNIINSNLDHNSTAMFLTNNQNVNAMMSVKTINSSFSHSGTGINLSNSGHAVIEATNSSFNQNNVFGITVSNKGDVHIKATDSSFDHNNTGMNFNNLLNAEATIETLNSSFDGNNTGMFFYNSGSATATITATGSSFNGNNDTGMYLFNSATNSIFSIEAIDSAFKNNTNFGVFGQNNNVSTDMDITLINPEFSGNGANTNQAPGDNIDWTITP